MKVTQEYLNNVKEIEKFIKTFNFDEASTARIRQYIENPLSVVNDDIKALFAKYDNEIVDYRIPLPASMMKQRRKLQREIFLIYSLLFDCLSADEQFKFKVNEHGEFQADFSVSPFSVAEGFFKIGNDKRKIWRYLDSKTTNIAERLYKKWLTNKTFSVTPEGYYKEYVDIKSTRLGFSQFFMVMSDYVASLGTRKTSLKDKIQKLGKSDSIMIDVTGKSEEDAIKTIANDAIKPIFNITQEIISAKMIDLDKYKLYLSFNVFDWLLASSGETWHSCIDMASSYCYGVGMLGMCGCPDWGMLLYTDGSMKEFSGIKTYHIVTRSWVCYLESGEFQLIGWYPKDIRGSVTFTSSEDFKFFTFNERTGEKYSGKSSKSDWEPIVFSNGAVAWIYSDMYRINIDKGVHIKFSFDGATGLPRLAKSTNDGKLYADHDGVFESILNSIKGRYSSIVDAVNHDYVINRDLITLKYKKYTCSCCGSGFSRETDVVYIPSEEAYVCRSCLQNHFFECPRCGEHHRYEHSREIQTGTNPWEYELICESCAESLESDEEIFMDEESHEYFYGSDERVYYDSNDNSHIVSVYTLNEMIADGRLFLRDGSYYNYGEGETN